MEPSKNAHTHTHAPPQILYETQSDKMSQREKKRKNREGKRKKNRGFVYALTWVSSLKKKKNKMDRTFVSVPQKSHLEVADTYEFVPEAFLVFLFLSMEFR